MIILRLVTGLLHLILGLLVWRASSKHTNSQKWFVIFSSTIALWLFSSAALFYYFNTLSLQITYAIGVWVGISAIIWVIYFTKRDLTRMSFFCILIVGIIFSVFSLLPDAVISSLSPIEKAMFAINVGKYYFIFIAFIAAILGTILWLLVSTFVSAKGIFREQIRYVLLGALIFGGDILLSDALFFSIGSGMVSLIDGISPLIFAGLSVYAMVRYRFMDIRFVFRKGTIYAVTIAIVLGVYTYLVFVISQTTNNVFKIGNNATSIVIIILVAVGFHPLRKMVEYTLNNYFFPKRLDLRAIGKRIASQLSTSITEIEKILKTIRDEARPALNTESIDLFFQKEQAVWAAVQPIANTQIRVNPSEQFFQHLSKKLNIIVTEELEYQMNESEDKEEIKSLEEVRKFLTENKIAVVVPILQHPDTIIGILFLGPKTNQSAYTIEDIQFLKNLQQNLSLSMSGIILYYQAMKMVEGKIRK